MHAKKAPMPLKGPEMAYSNVEALLRIYTPKRPKAPKLAISEHFCKKGGRQRNFLSANEKQFLLN